jgi:hypothetical protein
MNHGKKMVPAGPGMQGYYFINHVGIGASAYFNGGEYVLIPHSKVFINMNFQV